LRSQRNLKNHNNDLYNDNVERLNSNYTFDQRNASGQQYAIQVEEGTMLEDTASRQFNLTTETDEFGNLLNQN
jgi:hypothetical protein